MRSYSSQPAIGAVVEAYEAHADALEDAKAIKKQFEEAFSGLEIRLLELSPVFVAQGGPKCVAIQYIKR